MSSSQQEQRKEKGLATPTAESHDKEMSQHGEPKLEQQGCIRQDQWEDLIKKSYSDPVRSLSVVSIFRVPNFLKGSKTAETDSWGLDVPKRVSLGPYLHTTAELRLMDRHKGKALCRMKMRYLNNVRRLTDDQNNIEFCRSAVEEIKNLDKAIRDSYEETLVECVDEDTLALMLSLDGSFVLEILRTLKGDLDEPHQASKCYEPIFEFDKIKSRGSFSKSYCNWTSTRLKIMPVKSFNN